MKMYQKYIQNDLQNGTHSDEKRCENHEKSVKKERKYSQNVTQNGCKKKRKNIKNGPVGRQLEQKKRGLRPRSQTNAGNVPNHAKTMPK